MSFVEKIPSYHSELIKQAAATKGKINDLYAEIGEGNYDYHDCDCEFCPVPEAPDLSSKEVAEKEHEIEKLQDVLHDYKTTIRRLEGYAKIVKVKLEEVKL